MDARILSSRTYINTYSLFYIYSQYNNWTDLVASDCLMQRVLWCRLKDPHIHPGRGGENEHRGDQWRHTKLSGGSTTSHNRCIKVLFSRPTKFFSNSEQDLKLLYIVNSRVMLWCFNLVSILKLCSIICSLHMISMYVGGDFLWQHNLSLY